MREHYLWCEKYRPQTIAECILPTTLKRTLQGFVETGEVPNTLLVGKQGTGKTTAAEALCRELEVDSLKINASLEGNIDTLRTKILRFASSVSLMSTKRKIVILDEADYLNRQSTQPALRAFMEDYSANCGFILTCNEQHKLIEPLWSRSPPLEFVYPKTGTPESKALMLEYFARCKEILEKEDVPYEQKAVATLIKKYYPDWRITLMILQRYASTGKVDTGVLSAKGYSIGDLVPMLKEKDFKSMRQWAADNSESEATFIFRALYDHLYDFLVPATIPQAVLILNDGQKADAIVSDKELNMVATLTELMASVEFQ